jgi:ArsR family transcriptional regulator, arsenate/arsenite/antimonite-responsive transcriptional repressor
MNQETAIQIFETLSSGVRLDVIRLLVKFSPDGLVAGEISSQLDIAPNNLSFHLKAMTHANLLTVAQEGRFMRYKANLNIMQQVIAYLTAECCAGDASSCGFSVIPNPISKQNL